MKTQAARHERSITHKFDFGPPGLTTTKNKTKKNTRHENSITDKFDFGPLRPPELGTGGHNGPKSNLSVMDLS